MWAMFWNADAFDQPLVWDVSSEKTFERQYHNGPELEDEASEYMSRNTITVQLRARGLKYEFEETCVGQHKWNDREAGIFGSRNDRNCFNLRRGDGECDVDADCREGLICVDQYGTSFNSDQYKKVGFRVNPDNIRFCKTYTTNPFETQRGPTNCCIPRGQCVNDDSNRRWTEEAAEAAGEQ